MKEYFGAKQLPKTFTYPGGTIANSTTFVATQIHKMAEGVPAIQECSYDLLKSFRDVLG